MSTTAKPHGPNRRRPHPLTSVHCTLTPCTLTPAQYQYTFIHYAVLEALAFGDTSFRLADFALKYQKLQAPSSRDATKTLLQEEYDRLGSVRTMIRKSAFVKRVSRE